MIVRLKRSMMLYLLCCRFDLVFEEAKTIGECVGPTAAATYTNRSKPVKAKYAEHHGGPTNCSKRIQKEMVYASVIRCLFIQ